jgi:hypothetical protein
MLPKMVNDQWLLKTGIKAYMLKEKQGIVDEAAIEDEIAEIERPPTSDPHTQTHTQTHTHARVRLHAKPGYARSGPTLNI